MRCCVARRGPSTVVLEQIKVGRLGKAAMCSRATGQIICARRIPNDEKQELTVQDRAERASGLAPLSERTHGNT